MTRVAELKRNHGLAPSYFRIKDAQAGIVAEGEPGYQSLNGAPVPGVYAVLPAELRNFICRSIS